MAMNFLTFIIAWLLLQFKVQAQSDLDEFARRVLGPDLARQLDFVLVYQNEHQDDFFHYESDGGRLLITGSSRSALTSGLGWYDANVHISWSGIQNISLSKGKLPKVANPVLQTRVMPMTYYMNVCTFSYSTVWWDWIRWERELDWMALNGINTPLAITGQEFIWREVFVKQFNMTRGELDEFFTGPAFLAWHRMGNLRRWAGPLPDSWIDQQYELQRSIVRRARGLGMKTVLPAFSGHVPKAAKRIWPEADIFPSASWSSFEKQFTQVYMIEPANPIFVKIGSAFIQQIILHYGTDHLYSADTFNEIAPKSTERAFLVNTASATLKSMQSADPAAVWVMQAWMMTDGGTWTDPNIEAYLSGVPDDKLIILDLFSEVVPFYSRPNAFSGKSWVFNMLHNFGGNHGLYGRAQVISSEPLKALAKSKGKMIGIGLTPEGIEQNYVIYELMLEMAWRQEPVDLKQWFKFYQWRRYGGDRINSDAAEAWGILLDTVYQSDDFQWSVTKSIAVLEPALRYQKKFFMNPILYYDPIKLLDVWAKLLLCSASFANQTTFRYDVVDITRQVLSNLLLKIHSELVEAFNRNDLDNLELRSNSFLEVMRDLDKILGSDPHWLLGTWLDQARKAAKSDPVDLYVFNAKNLITMWGPKAEIEDYASKQWSGLISEYYLPRWQLFFEMLAQTARSSSRLNRSQFLRLSFKHCSEWQNTTSDQLPTSPIGDSIAISNELFRKYSGIITNPMPVYRCDYDNMFVAAVQ